MDLFVHDFVALKFMGQPISERFLRHAKVSSSLGTTEAPPIRLRLDPVQDERKTKVTSKAKPENYKETAR